LPWLHKGRVLPLLLLLLLLLRERATCVAPDQHAQHEMSHACLRQAHACAAHG
jgi:hypothetical protein